MRRIMLTVAYDGTDYSGWQIQPHAETIEGVLNRELSRLLQEEIRVIGASRTDAGVHAEGAVCVFDTESRIPAEKFSYALNRSLPEDIRIRASEEVENDFHPRKCDCRKTYEYRIWHDAFPMPTNQRYTYWIYTKLDVERMRKAASYLVGRHDFASFSSTHRQTENTIRTIYRLAIIENGKEVILSVCGDGFLYNMVRIIAGTLIEIGQGKREPEEVKDMLLARDRACSGPTAPPHGLVLMEYEFEY